MRHILVIAAVAGIASSAAAQPAKWLSALTGGHTLDKFAVEVELETTVGAGPKDPFARKDTGKVYLECDFTVALQCTNESVASNGPVVWLTRDRDDSKAKPYSLRLRPPLSIRRIDFGPFNADEMRTGTPLQYRSEDKRSKSVTEIRGRLYIVEPAKKD